MTRHTTMLELVTDLSRHARSEEEVIATVVALVNSGAARLCGTFKGQRFDVSPSEVSWCPEAAS